MPARISSRIARRFGLTEERARLYERRSRLAGVVTMVVTGIAFIAWPPMSTQALWGGNFIAPVTWGLFMALAGALSVWGILSRVLQIEQTGMFIMWLALGFYTVNQGMIMFETPITWTRAGGTSLLVAFLFLTFARYWALTADIIVARIARIKEGR